MGTPAAMPAEDSWVEMKSCHKNCGARSSEEEFEVFDGCKRQ